MARADGQAPGRRVGVDLGVAELRQHVPGEAARLGAVPQAAAPWLPAHQDVLRHREVREERELLVDEGDATVPRVARRARRVGRAADLHRARLRHEKAPQDAEERALAGPVLAEEGVHLAGAHLERRAVEGDRGPETVDDAGEPQRRRHSPGLRYVSRGGLRRSRTSGVSRLAGVTTSTPVSTRFGTGFPSR